MNYVIVYTNRACRDVSKLDSVAKQRINKALQRYSKAPLKYSKKMMDPSLGSYRFRIGDYRVIFDIEGSEIIILRVGHRRDIFKRGQ